MAGRPIRRGSALRRLEELRSTSDGLGALCDRMLSSAEKETSSGGGDDAFDDATMARSPDEAFRRSLALKAIDRVLRER